MGHNKRGHKKKHSIFGHGFKKGFKHGFIGTANAMGSAAPLVAMIPGAGPEIAGGMAAVSELEKDGLATIDSIGAKDPEKRFQQTRNI
jgi:hypothetical protein